MNLDRTIAKSIFNSLNDYYKIIPNIKNFFLDIDNIDREHYTEIKENIWIGKNVSIDSTSVIEGPCIIDDDTIIGPFTYIRENVIIGKKCHIGHAVEIKNSIVFDECQISHYNYVGDSIIGYKSHLAAGVIISNLKNDQSNIRIDNTDTGLRKLGAIIYDNVEVGSNCVIFPGTIVHSNVSIYPLTRVRGIINENTIVKDDNIIVNKE